MRSTCRVPGCVWLIGGRMCSGRRALGRASQGQRPTASADPRRASARRLGSGSKRSEQVTGPIGVLRPLTSPTLPGRLRNEGTGSDPDTLGLRLPGRPGPMPPISFRAYSANPDIERLPAAYGCTAVRPGMRVFAQIRWRFAWPQKRPQQDSNLRTRLRRGFPENARACIYITMLKMAGRPSGTDRVAGRSGRNGAAADEAAATSAPRAPRWNATHQWQACTYSRARRVLAAGRPSPDRSGVTRPAPGRRNADLRQVEVPWPLATSDVHRGARPNLGRTRTCNRLNAGPSRPAG